MSKQRNVMTRILAAGVSALTLGAVVVGGLAGSASADSLPSNVDFSQWSDVGFHWTTGDLNTGGTNTGHYAEGETVPFLVDVTTAGVGTYSFSVCRDYMRDNAYGYLSLLPYDTNRLPLLPALATSLDAATGSSQPFTGAAVEGSVHIDSVHEVGAQGACAKGQRETQLEITIGAGVGGLAPIAAYVLYGGHLASPVDVLPGGGFVGIGNGASSYPGATLSMGLPAAQKTLSIKLGAAASAGTLTVNDIVAPSTDPGRFDLQIDGSTAGTGANVGDGGTTGVIPVYSGSHDVGAAGSGTTNLADYQSSVICADGNGPVTVTGGSVSVTNGDNVVCTVTLTPNAPDPGSGGSGDQGSSTNSDTTSTTTSATTDTTSATTDTTSATTDTTSATTDTTDTTDTTSATTDTTSATTDTTSATTDTTSGTTDTTSGTTDTTSATTDTTVPDQININDPLPSSTTTTTTIAPKHHTQPGDDDGSGGDNSDVDPTDTTPTTITTTTTVDPGSTVAGGGQPAPAVLGAVVEQPAPAADPAPASDPAPAMAPAGTLPRTGAAVEREAGLALALVAAGLAFLGLARRRRPSAER